MINWVHQNDLQCPRLVLLSNYYRRPSYTANSVKGGSKIAWPAVTQVTRGAESCAFSCSTYVNDQMENIIVLYMYILSSRWIPDRQLADNQGSDQHKADVPCVTCCWLVGGWQLLNFRFWCCLSSPPMFWIIVLVHFVCVGRSSVVYHTVYYVFLTLICLSEVRNVCGSAVEVLLVSSTACGYFLCSPSLACLGLSLWVTKNWCWSHITGEFQEHLLGGFGLIVWLVAEISNYSKVRIRRCMV